MIDVALAVETEPDTDTSLADLAHLVLKRDWPVALCGYVVQAHLGTNASGRDRCAECLAIAARRGLGRPGWGG